MGMHIQSIDGEIVGSEVDRLKHFSESKMLAVSVQDNLIGALLHLVLDETQKMFLVHAAGVVNVGIDFTCIVEIAKQS